DSSHPSFSSVFFLLFFCPADAPRCLRSFPTRRSSDLDLFYTSLHSGSGVFQPVGPDPVITCRLLPAENAASFITGNSENHSGRRSEEHTSELQSRENLVCRLLPGKTHSASVASGPLTP